MEKEFFQRKSSMQLLEMYEDNHAEVDRSDFDDCVFALAENLYRNLDDFTGI
jgi:hypothetical protein